LTLVEGLKPRRHLSDGAVIDELIDQFAPDGQGRKLSVFMYPRIDQMKNKYHGGNILLEVMVDPKKARIADIKYFNLAKEAYELADDIKNDPQIRRWGQMYWQTSMSYADYLRLPEEERKEKYIEPEVLTPYDIPGKDIQIKSSARLT
jgi:hypothetical protein